MFILYKEGKIDYLFLESYRPIALENTLSKILERVIADRMTDMAKKNILYYYKAKYGQERTV